MRTLLNAAQMFEEGGDKSRMFEALLNMCVAYMDPQRCDASERHDSLSHANRMLGPLKFQFTSYFSEIPPSSPNFQPDFKTLSLIKYFAVSELQSKDPQFVHHIDALFCVVHIAEAYTYFSSQQYQLALTVDLLDVLLPSLSFGTRIWYVWLC